MAEQKPAGANVAQARTRSQGMAAAEGAAMVRSMGAPQPPQTGRHIDLATIFGLLTAFALVTAALLLGGNVAAFWNVPSILITIGGTLAVTAVSFAWTDVKAALRLIGSTVASAIPHPQTVARFVVQMADYARRTNGPLSLQSMAATVTTDGLLKRALDVIIDGLPADDVERILRTEIEAAQARARAGAAVLRRAAEVAPAMGLIGTLVGLVQMLGSLHDPATIGPAMAVALLTTFYGAVLGSMVLSPLAGKVERNADAQALVGNLYMLAAVSMARQENPRRLEMIVNTVLPPEHRLSSFD